MEVSRPCQWCLDKGEEEWLRLKAFISLASLTPESIIAALRKEMDEITEELAGRLFERSKYVPPLAWKGLCAELVWYKVA